MAIDADGDRGKSGVDCCGGLALSRGSAVLKGLLQEVLEGEVQEGTSGVSQRLRGRRRLLKGATSRCRDRLLRLAGVVQLGCSWTLGKMAWW